jgi:hypothetical protein
MGTRSVTADAVTDGVEDDVAEATGSSGIGWIISRLVCQITFSFTTDAVPRDLRALL